MPATLNFDVLQHERYLSLESFSENGQGVHIPVWFAGEPAAGPAQTLYVYSNASSGQAKRIRRDARVRVAPCDVRGKLRGDWIEGQAEIVTGDEAARGMRLLNEKYAPWKGILDMFSKLTRHQRVMFAIRPA